MLKHIGIKIVISSFGSILVLHAQRDGQSNHHPEPAVAGAGIPSDQFDFKFENQRFEYKNTNAGLLLVTSSHDDEERYDQVASADVDALVLLVALPARHYDTGTI